MDAHRHAPPYDLMGTNTTWIPDLIYTGGRFERDTALACDALGNIIALVRLPPSHRLETDDTPRSLVFPASGLALTTRIVRLRGRALLPGLVNAHSHAFQRVIRGRTEYRSVAGADDSFWTWREMMYSAAARLSPADIYDASRMAFLEMSLGGITAIGEFHYLHRTPEGIPYDDPNLLAREVVRAARDTGLRIALLRVAYARSGFQLPPNPRQSRFIEADADTYLRHVERLKRDIELQYSVPLIEAPPTKDTHAQPTKDASAQPTINSAHAQPTNGAEANTADEDSALPLIAPHAWVGVAPHSTRAVPLAYLRALCAFADEHRLPVHMHVAEQQQELKACLAEHGRTPVALLAGEGCLSERFTAVHAVHITDAEAHALAAARATVCACPTTERNLGDGIVPADILFRAGARISLGTDSHTQIDILEDARELEYHLRLDKQRRNVLAPADDAQMETSAALHNERHNRGDDGSDERARDKDDEQARDKMSALAARLFACATANGARSIGAQGGTLAAGRPADFFTVALDDPSIAGASDADLLPAILFSLARTALRETVVGGRLIVADGRHAATAEIIERFRALQRRLWS